MKIRIDTAALLTILSTLMATKREWIRYQMRYWPGWRKVLLMIFFSAFACAAMLHTADLLDDFLAIFDIEFPTP